MDVLPSELLIQVLHNLPPQNRKTARLTSRRFNAVLAKPSFDILASFIDPKVALTTLETTAADLRTRPRSIWSPHCGVPDDLPIPESFLMAMFVALGGDSWPVWSRGRRLGWSDASSSGSSDEESCDDDYSCPITVQSLNQALERKDITEDLLRQAMFRYALYMSYVYQGEGTAPHLWVCNSKLWIGRS